MSVSDFVPNQNRIVDLCCIQKKSSFVNCDGLFILLKKFLSYFFSKSLRRMSQLRERPKALNDPHLDGNLCTRSWMHFIHMVVHSRVMTKKERKTCADVLVRFKKAHILQSCFFLFVVTIARRKWLPTMHRIFISLGRDSSRCNDSDISLGRNHARSRTDSLHWLHNMYTYTHK